MVENMENPVVIVKEYIDTLIKDNMIIKGDINVFKNFLVICAGLKDDTYENVYHSSNIYKLLRIENDRQFIEDLRLIMNKVRFFFKTNMFDKKYNIYITQKRYFVVEKKNVDE